MLCFATLSLYRPQVRISASHAPLATPCGVQRTSQPSKKLITTSGCTCSTTPSPLTPGGMNMPTATDTRVRSHNYLFLFFPPLVMYIVNYLFLFFSLLVPLLPSPCFISHSPFLPVFTLLRLLRFLSHAGHAVELPFVFSTLSLGNFTPTALETELAVNMTRYWTNFAKNGNPNDFYETGRSSNPSHTLYKGSRVQRLPDWPSYYVDGETGTKNAGCMRFKTPSSEVGSVEELPNSAKSNGWPSDKTAFQCSRGHCLIFEKRTSSLQSAQFNHCCKELFFWT